MKVTSDQEVRKMNRELIVDWLGIIRELNGDWLELDLSVVS